MKYLLLSLILIANPALAQQPPREVGTHLTDPVRMGEANVRYLGFNLYNAQLWTSGKGFSYGQPFALTLTYKRAFSARDLAEMTVKEVARIERTSPRTHQKLAALERCFADVQPSDRITGISRGPDRAIFYVNGRKSCDFSYPSFSKRFFGIWLGQNTRDPKSRARLLGTSG